MSKFEVKASSEGEDDKKVTVQIKGKLSDEEWEDFRECLLKCLKPYRRKLKIKITGRR